MPKERRGRVVCLIHHHHGLRDDPAQSERFIQAPSFFHGANAAFCSRRPFLCRWNESSFAALKPQNCHLRCSGAARTGLVFACFAPQNRRKREGSRGFVRISWFRLCVWGFREKNSLRRLELIKFPMPVARHENKQNPAHPQHSKFISA